MNVRKGLIPACWSDGLYDQWRDKIQAAFDEYLLPAASLDPAQVDYRHLIQCLHQLGVSGLRFSVQQGGQGVGLAAQAIFAECLGTVPSLAIGTVLTAQLDTVAPLIGSLGSPEQIERFLQPALAGKLLFSHALPEAEARPVKALRDDTGWRIHGRLTRILLAPIADMHLVAARLNDCDPGANLLFFLVPADRSGVRVTQAPRMADSNECPIGDIEFNDVRVDDACCLGEAGTGHAAQLPHSAHAGVLSSLRINQMSRQCLDRIIAYLHERKINGESLIQLTVLQHRLAALECEYGMTRALAYRALSECMAGDEPSLSAPACTLLSSRLLRKVSKEALQLGGVAHYRSDSPIARFYTDSITYASLIESDAATLHHVAALMTRRNNNGIHMQDSAFASDLASWIASEIAPKTDQWLFHGKVPFRALIRSLADVGLLTQGWDAPYGCGDIRKQLYLHYRLAQQPIGGIGLCVASHVDIGARFLAKKASERIATQWLPGALKGELIMALAITEPDSGSDLQGIEFSAQKTKGGWCLNGTKRGITNLPFADAAIVLARTRAGRTPFSYSLFLVPLDAPGVTREAALRTLGYEGCLGGLVAHDAMLSEEHLIGPAGGGLISLMQHLEIERLFVSSRMLGAAEYVFAQILEVTSERRACDQHAELCVAELCAKLQAFQAYFALCLSNYASGTFRTKDSAALKYMGSQLLKALTESYLAYCSTDGCLESHPAKRCHREALGLSLAGGSEEIMLSLIGREL